MSEKETNGLTSKEIDEDLKAKSAQPNPGRGYHGMQDTGDQIVRSKGTDVQQNDGLPHQEQGHTNKDK